MTALPGIPKLGGRPRKEYYARVDPIKDAKKRKSADVKMHPCGAIVAKKPRTCGRCGCIDINNHNSVTCAKRGYIQSEVDRNLLAHAGIPEPNTTHQMSWPDLPPSNSTATQEIDTGTQEMQMDTQMDIQTETDIEGVRGAISEGSLCCARVVNLAPLSHEELWTYREEMMAWDVGTLDDVVEAHSSSRKEVITREDVRRLEWDTTKVAHVNDLYLNDSIMVVYGNLLNDVCAQLQSQLGCRAPSVAVCKGAGIFYQKMMTDGGKVDYDRVKNWQRRTNPVKSLNALCFPINHDNIHWYLVVLNFVMHQAEIYDSLPGLVAPRVRKKVASNLLEWLDTEVTRNHLLGQGHFVSAPSNPTGATPTKWRILDTKELGAPKQKNGWDCGVFVLKFMHQVVIGQTVGKLEGAIQAAEGLPILRGRIACDIHRGRIE
jgi:hypothetical protein